MYTGVWDPKRLQTRKPLVRMKRKKKRPRSPKVVSQSPQWNSPMAPLSVDQSELLDRLEKGYSASKDLFRNITVRSLLGHSLSIIRLTCLGFQRTQVDFLTSWKQVSEFSLFNFANDFCFDAKLVLQVYFYSLTSQLVFQIKNHTSWFLKEKFALLC